MFDRERGFQGMDIKQHNSSNAYMRAKKARDKAVAALEVVEKLSAMKDQRLAYLEECKELSDKKIQALEFMNNKLEKEKNTLVAQLNQIQSESETKAKSGLSRLLSLAVK